VQGPFLLRLESVRRTQRAQLTDRAAYPSLDVRALVAWEPTLPVLGIGTIGVVTEAVDDRGQSLTGRRAKPSVQGITTHRWQQNILLPLTCPEDPGRRIARLTGYFPMVVKGPDDFVLEIPDPQSAAPRRFTVEGRELEFKSIMRTGRRYVVNIDVFGPRDNTDRYLRFNTTCFQLEDDRGSKFRPTTWSFTADSRVWQLKMEYDNFPDQPLAKLVITLPTKLQEIDVPFDFKDIPLP
jgi:hypothetical protein